PAPCCEAAAETRMSCLIPVLRCCSWRFRVLPGSVGRAAWRPPHIDPLALTDPPPGIVVGILERIGDGVSDLLGSADRERPGRRELPHDSLPGRALGRGAVLVLNR